MQTLDAPSEQQLLTLQELKVSVLNGSANKMTDAAFIKYLDKNPDAKDTILEDEDLLTRYNGKKRALKKEVQRLLGEAREEMHILNAKENYKQTAKKEGLLSKILWFPARHPVITVATALALYLGYTNFPSWDTIMAWVQRLRCVNAAAAAATGTAAPAVAAPGITEKLVSGGLAPTTTQDVIGIDDLFDAVRKTTTESLDAPLAGAK